MPTCAACLRPGTSSLPAAIRPSFAAGQCAAGDFKGEIWGLNPHRAAGAIPSYISVAELPEPPDAVLAVPRQGVPAVIKELREKGAGGIVCYSAGFGELGDDGVSLERELIDACGDMALAGPNVFGLLNYITGAHLWPSVTAGYRRAGSCPHLPVRHAVGVSPDQPSVGPILLRDWSGQPVGTRSRGLP